MRSSFSPGLLLILAACSSSAARPAESPAPAAAPAARSLTYSPGTTRYRLVSHTHQEQQMEGNKQQFDIMLEYFVTVTLTRETDHSTRLALLVDSLRSEGGRLNPGELDRARGAQLWARLSADGRVTELTGDSLFTGQLQVIPMAARQLFPRLPPGDTDPGRQWTDTTEVRTSGSPQLTLRAVNDRRVVDWTENAGKRALTIQVESRYTIAGSGQQMGQDYTLDGGGERRSTSHVSADGRFLGTVARDSSSSTVSLTSLGMSFPTLQHRVDTVTALP